MKQTWEYIEAYFTQALSSDERKSFEVRCERDESFAREVAFYLTARSAARELVIEKKQKTFDDDKTEEKQTAKAVPVKKIMLHKWIPYAAAACILLFVAVYFIIGSPAPQNLAGRYIKENYTTLSLKMDASRDTMQLGIAAYNGKDYQQAQVLFESIRQSNPASSDAKKFAGLAYLQTKNYDKALECFEELAAMKGLFVNSGDVLKAVTLLQRNAQGDKDKAKLLLEKVVRENEEGSKQAKEWLDKW